MGYSREPLKRPGSWEARERPHVSPLWELELEDVASAAIETEETFNYTGEYCTLETMVDLLHIASQVGNVIRAWAWCGVLSVPPQYSSYRGIPRSKI